MDWVPVAFITFKAIVFGACMFYAIKWHYEQGKKKGEDSRTLLLTSTMVVGGFVAAVGLVMYLTFYLATSLGMDLSF